MNKYRCQQCGQEHDEWPALAFLSPVYYHSLAEEDKAERAELGSDHCVIRWEDQTDRFIRVVLVIEVNDHCDNLEYGLWVSVSEASFSDYMDNYDPEADSKTYFGWLSSQLPDYEDMTRVPVTIQTQPDQQRPLIYPHRDHEHALVKDFYEGISLPEAERRVAEMMAGR